MNRNICKLACKPAVISKIAILNPNDISRKRTNNAATVRAMDDKNPMICSLGNNLAILHQSFQVDEAEDENPNNVQEVPVQ